MIYGIIRGRKEHGVRHHGGFLCVGHRHFRGERAVGLRALMGERLDHFQRDDDGKGVHQNAEQGGMHVAQKEKTHDDTDIDDARNQPFQHIINPFLRFRTFCRAANN